MLYYNGIQPFTCQRHAMWLDPSLRLRMTGSAQDDGNALAVIPGSGVTVVPDSGRGSPPPVTALGTLFGNER